jgi:hypothetical protein
LRSSQERRGGYEVKPYIGHDRATWDMCAGKLASHRSRQKAKDVKRAVAKRGKSRERQRAKTEIEEATE